MKYNFIKTSIDQHIFKLTLARPEKRNAFTPTMVNEISHAIEEANKDKTVRLVMINAEGPVFCAGMDMKTFENPALDILNPEIQNQHISLASAISQLNKPSIAIVEGDVLAGGFLIVLECTYIFAKKEAKFSLPEVKRGIFPFQVLASLIKYIPQNKALDLCITAKEITAVEAKELGIVYGFLEEGKPTELMKAIIENAPKAIYAGFEAIKNLGTLTEKERLPYLLQALEDLKKTKDAKEGMAAFFDKRVPNWTNE
ncbi:MAG: enoyl-CoA hydratase/isomerase family protein [Sediminibacterium sp.]|jgi:enoyl-CoA hydratase/carnithine racemase